MEKLAAVILAAGASRRFGSPKQIARFQGRTFLDHQITALEALSETDTYVVIGAHSELVKPAISSTTIGVIENQDWQSGVSSSIKKAVFDLKENYSALLFVAVDQVCLQSRHYADLLALSRENPEQITATRYDDKLFGIPVVFPRTFYRELSKLSGDRGAKSVVSNNLEYTRFFDCPEARADVDTPAELKYLSENCLAPTTSK